MCHRRIPSQDKLVKENCEQVLKSRPTTIFHAIKHTNKWIYAVPKRTRLTVKCPTNPGYIVKDMDIENAGILSLPSNCEGSTNGNLLIAKYACYTNLLLITDRVIIPNITSVEEIVTGKSNIHWLLTTSNISDSISASLRVIVDSTKQQINSPSGFPASHLAAIETLAREASQSLLLEHSSHLYITITACTTLALLILYLVYRYAAYKQLPYSVKCVTSMHLEVRDILSHTCK